VTEPGFLSPCNPAQLIDSVTETIISLFLAWIKFGSNTVAQDEPDRSVGGSTLKAIVFRVIVSSS
jgi:hypothetical protein